MMKKGKKNNLNVILFIIFWLISGRSNSFVVATGGLTSDIYNISNVDGDADLSTISSPPPPKEKGVDKQRSRSFVLCTYR